ncbi:MAG: glycosyltransferase family 2 protein [Candidatus Uhrbacteria bacterium]|nr:glycosyltransferase family 2 protein [Candidatus Uhrbacteria bacterium]
MKPKVAIIYLCYNNLRHMPEVISSIAKLDYPKESMSFIMIPNNSPDGIADVIVKDVLPRSLKDLPEVILMDDGVNHGFAKGNNIGVRWALERDFDYVFLHNGDLKLHQMAVTELVEMMESDKNIGSAQSLVLYWKKPDIVNVAGGQFHVAGYGFGNGNLSRLEDMKIQNGQEVTYSSGAAVMYRSSALKEVGLLEEGFFMYHEDLELGLRLRFAGYKNVLNSTSLAFHDYSFSRNPKKFAWTELYRWVVVLSYYKLATLMVLAPLLLLIEIGTWFMALMGGWLGAKLWAYKEMLRPRTWKLIWNIRRRAQTLRVIRDKELLRHVVGTIEAQETSNWIVDYFANPIINLWWRAARFIIIW